MSYGITASVTNPCVCTDKFGKFVSYKVTSESTKSGFRPGSITVDRRYNDFTWLQSELARELPGCILPPLPEKQSMGRLEHEFIEVRRRGLERYLSRLFAHPELSSSHFLVIFLQSDDAAFSRAKEDSKASRPKMTSSAVNWFEGKVNTIAYGKATVDRTPADDKVDEMQDYVLRLEKQVEAIVKHSNSVVKRWRETCVSMYELSQSLKAVDPNSVGADTAQVGNAVERVAAAYGTHADIESSRFTEPIDDYTRILQNVRYAIQQRAEKRSAYTMALTDVDVKSAQLRKAQSTPGKDTKSKEASLATAEAVRDAAKAEFDRVTDRLLREFEAFQQKQAHDWRVALGAYIEVQHEHVRRMENVWEEVAPGVQAHDISVSSIGSSLTKVAFGNAPTRPLSATPPPPVPTTLPPPLPDQDFHSGYGSGRPGSGHFHHSGSDDGHDEFRG